MEPVVELRIVYVLSVSAEPQHETARKLMIQPRSRMEWNAAETDNNKKKQFICK